MTNYNDGEWHGWNGGECPVHPNTIIEGYWRHGETTSACESVYNVGPARCYNFLWDGGTKLKHFRVIKEHREPREWWAVGLHLHDTEAVAEQFLALLRRDNPGRFDDFKVIRVREVLE